MNSTNLYGARDCDWEPEPTHYIPAFTVFRGREQRQQRAACGQLVAAADYAVEPTCQACAAYVNADPYAGLSGEEVF